MSNGAAAIVSDQPGSFAWGVWNKRHPVLIKQIQDAFPYPSEVHRALDALLDETLSGTIQPLPADAHDYALWQAWDRGWYGGSWRRPRSCGRRATLPAPARGGRILRGRGRGGAWIRSRRRSMRN